jgi:hypothetical protein
MRARGRTGRVAARVIAASALVAVAGPIAPVASDAVAADSATSATPAVTIAGMDMSGFASPLSMLVYEPLIPVPTAPQGELRYAYTEASLQAGPFATALSSSLYPGATLTNGLHAFNPALPAYPVVTRAAYPGTETSSSKSVGAADMTAKAGEEIAQASAKTGSSPLDAVVDFGTMSSTTTMSRTDKEVVSNAIAQASDIKLMTGIIRIKSVVGETTATSNAKTSDASGRETATGISVAGQNFTVDDKGVHGGGIQVPGLLGNLLEKQLPKTGNALLKRFGISFTLPKVTKHRSGTSAKSFGQGLVVSIDTKPFKQALSSLPLQQLVKLTPNACLPDNPGTDQLPFGKCLHDNLDAVLNLGPQIDFLFVNTSVAASAVPLLPFPTGPVVPPVTPQTPTGPVDNGTTTPGLPGTLGTPGSFAPGAPATGEPPVVAQASPSAFTLPDLFTGISPLLFLGALIVGTGLFFLLRWFGLIPLVGAAAVAGCEYGAPGGAPDRLRRG